MMIFLDEKTIVGLKNKKNKRKVYDIFSFNYIIYEELTKYNEKIKEKIILELLKIGETEIANKVKNNITKLYHYLEGDGNIENTYIYYLTLDIYDKLIYVDNKNNVINIFFYNLLFSDKNTIKEDREKVISELLKIGETEIARSFENGEFDFPVKI